MKYGQSLIEVIVALSILVIALTAGLALAANNLAVGKESELRLIAANLAREGVEVARNIRDSNRLANIQNLLDSGLESGNDYTTIAVYDSGGNTWELKFDPDDFTDNRTQVYRSGDFYLQATSQPSGSSITPFRRLITLNEICADPVACGDGICESGQSCTEKIGIQILSEVQWTGRGGRPSSTLVEDRIYKW